MQTYLVFLKNLANGEEFVAPATADKRDEAMLAIGEKYPPRLYAMHTVYTLAEVERIVDDIKRWPGVASSVQPLVEQLAKRSASAGSLPREAEPVSAPKPAAMPAGPRLSVIDAIRAAQGGTTRVDSRVEMQKLPPLPTSSVEATPTAAPAKRTMAASIISRPAQPARPASVLQVLKSLRG